MTDELLIASADIAAGELDAERRVWLVGVAHLADVPEIREMAPGEVTEIIHVANTTVDFPSGPVGFVDGGFTVEDNPDYALLTLASASAPHLELKLGLGMAGFVAVGLTRTDVLDDGSHWPGAVLLSDVESVLADIVQLGIAAALRIGYWGPINLLIKVADRRPEASLSVLTVDEETGRAVLLRELPSGESPTVLGTMSYTAESTPRSVHAELRAVAEQLATQFGAPEPQLIVSVLDEQDFRYDDEVLGPLR